MGSGGKIISGLGWQFTQRIASQVVTFVVSIILARLLTPADYGVIAMVMVFIGIANVLVSSGLGSALIQKKDADELDFSSVFYAQLGIALVLYLVIFLSAPYLIAFFHMEGEDLPAVLRVLGLNIPINAAYNVQSAFVSRKMDFKKFFYATLAGTAVSAAVGVSMAYSGLGVWALVGQYLTNSLINTVVLGLVIKWRPGWQFSFVRLKPLFGFGWKIFTADVVNTLLNNLRTLIVGKKYTSEDLAFYEKGEQFPSLIVTNINTTIQSVLFPAMSNVQGERERVKELLRNMISIGSFVIFPLVYGFLAVSDSVVRLLLTDKWAACIPFVQIFCVSYSLRIISTSCAQTIKALGRSDIYLKASTVYKILELVCIVATALISVKAIAVGTVINALILVLIHYACNRKLLDYRLREFAADLLPNVALAAIMVAVVLGLGTCSRGMWMVALQVLVGGIIYVGGALMLRMKPMHVVLQLICDRVRKK